MRYAVNVRNISWLLRCCVTFIVLCLCANVLIIHEHAFGTSIISARICDEGSEALLEIADPPSGATVSASPVSISGFVEQVSQVTVYLNGQYSHTIPIDSGATSFSYLYAITPGSHTLRFEGQDICQRSTPAEEVAYTFNPPAIPARSESQNQPEPTSVNPIGPREASGGQVYQPLTAPESPRLPSLLVPLYAGFASLLTIIGVIPSPGDMTFVAVMRFLLIVFGATIILGSRWLSGGIVSIAGRRGVTLDRAVTAKRLFFIGAILIALGIVLS